MRFLFIKIMQTISIGTTPIIILQPTKMRAPWELQFIPSSIIAGNSGKVFISRGSVPSATAGDLSQGEVLTAGAVTGGGRQGDIDVPANPREVWAVSDTSNQICVLNGGDEISS